MNKKNTRKGFTIVELVIVIAVIAILATVLVPTFGNIITKANNSKALQAARNELTNYMIEVGAAAADDLIIKGDTDKYFAVVNGEMDEEVYASTTAALAAFTSITNAEATVVAATDNIPADTVYTVAAKTTT